MNKVILMGRLTRDPDVRYSSGDGSTAVARYTLAVDRRFHRDGDATADFIGCVAFGRQAEFAEKYLPSPVGSKPEAIRTVKAGRFPQPMWLWKSRSLQRVRTRNVRGSRAQHHRQIRTVS